MADRRGRTICNMVLQNQACTGVNMFSPTTSTELSKRVSNAVTEYLQIKKADHRDTLRAQIIQAQADRKT